MSVNKDIGDIKADIAGIKKDISYIVKMVEAHNKMLYGNGNIGIKNQVKILWFVFLGTVAAYLGLK